MDDPLKEAAYHIERTKYAVFALRNECSCYREALQEIAKQKGALTHELNAIASDALERFVR